MASFFPLSLDKYEFKEIIGSGPASCVYVAKCTANDQILSIKLIDLNKFPYQEIISRELQFWSQCHSSDIVNYYGSFVSEKTQYILTPFFPYGSIENILNSEFPNGFQDESLIACILSDVLHALDYIHQNLSQLRIQDQPRNWGIIRASNFMLDETGQVRLDNFSLSTALFQSGQKKGSMLSMFADVCYTAPEVLKNPMEFSIKSDIWTLGLVAIELATGKMPYSNLHFMEGLIQIINQPPPSLPETFSPEFRDFVRVCLDPDPSQRLLPIDLIRSPFIMNANTHKYVRSILCVPKNRRYDLNQNKIDIENPTNSRLSFSASEEKIGRFRVTTLYVPSEIELLQKQFQQLKDEVHALENENEELREFLNQINTAIRNSHSS